MTNWTRYYQLCDALTQHGFNCRLTENVGDEYPTLTIRKQVDKKRIDFHWNTA